MSSAVRLSDMRPAITKQTMCSPVHSVLQCHSIYRGKGSVLAAAGSQSSGAWNVELPNGVFWLDRASHNHDVVYGQVSFYTGFSNIRQVMSWGHAVPLSPLLLMIFAVLLKEGHGT